MKAAPLFSLAKSISKVALHRVSHGRRRDEWSITFEALVQQLVGMRRNTEHLPVPVQRATWDRLSPPNMVASRVTVSRAAGAPVPSLWCMPKGRASGGPVVLYLHGGAFCFGSFRTHGELVSRIALASGARVLFPEYRLAPEHPHPAAVEDVVASYEHLLRTEDPSRIIVAGDSAGGNLTLQVLLHARREKLPMPAGGALLCPWVDVEEEVPGAGADDWTSNEWGATFRSAYLGGARANEPRISPAFADLRGLPPLFVQAGSAELLAGQIERFVEKARGEGVDVAYELAPGMVHTFQMFAALHAPAREAIDSIGRFVRRRTTRPGEPIQEARPA